MPDPVHDAILELIDDMIARVEAVQAENREFRSQITALQQRAVAVETPAQIEVREGPAGRGVESAEIREGRLMLRYTDGQEAIVGTVVGDPGKDAVVDAEQLRAMIREEIPAPVKPEDGKPGVGIDRVRMVDGNLEIRLTSGEEVNVGRVAGDKGDPGADGIASEEDLEARIEARFRDLQARTLADLYRGVWKAGESYRRGDTVTWGGSLFLALSNTRAKPESTEDWQLITKRGRDGRDRT